MFFVIGNWRLVDGEIDSDQISRVAAEVRQQRGLVGDRWRHDPDDADRALALVILEDESSVHTVVKAFKARIPSADLRMVKVLAHQA